MSNGYYSTPPVVKNLLIINCLFLLATELLPDGFVNGMYQYLALFPAQNRFFLPTQLITYMFLHANFMHLFSNMFAVWMFGRILEYDMGSKRFLIFYLVCGFGAGLIQLAVNSIEISHVASNGLAGAAALQQMMNVPTVGASGAVFGILLGFGLLHPNSRIMLLFPPIPMKAKWFVIAYGVFELFVGVSGRMDNIAHFAHLGGMLWGFLLLWYWKKRGKIHY